MLSDFLTRILSAPAWAVLGVVGLLVFAEDALFVGFVLPGETAAVLGGVSANLGHVPFAAVLVVVMAAAIVGDSVGYEVGRAFGPRILRARALARHEHRLDEARQFLANRGGWAVLLGRWVAFFRAVMPALAGLSRMPYRTFLLFNAIGGIIWSAVVVTAGYVAGASYQAVEKKLGTSTAIGAAVLVVALLVWWRVREARKERRGESS